MRSPRRRSYHIAIKPSTMPREVHLMSTRAIGKSVLMIACVLSTYGILSCGVLRWNSMSDAAENEAITIGAVLPLTGEAAHWGIPVRNGALAEALLS